MRIPGNRGIDHVAYTVPDMRQAISFFVDVMGCELVFTTKPEPGEDTGQWNVSHLEVAAEAQVEIAMLRIDDRMNLELFEYTVPNQAMKPPANSDVGGSHLAFYVDDMDAAIEVLRKVDGVHILGGITHHVDDPSFAGLRMVYVRTPWGSYLELVSYPDGLGYEAHTDRRLAVPQPRATPSP